MKEYIINKTNENQRLDKYLKRIMPSASNAFIYKMLRKKNIELNGKRAKGDEMLKAGDTIKIFFSDETFSKMQSPVKKTDNNEYIEAYKNLKDVRVIFEHEDFMIVYKPEGILTQKDNSNIGSLNEWCLGYLLSCKYISEESLSEFTPSVLNRLDRNTRGLVLFSKTLKGSQRLSSMLNKRDIKKYYIAKTKGNCDLSGVYKAYLYKNTKSNKVTIYDDQESIPAGLKYSPISTGIRVIDSNNEYSYLEINLLTGKSHQIRAHLSHLGFPLSGDAKYKGKTDSENRHQNLCAYKIVFPDFDKDDEWYLLSGKVIELKDY
ncbi:MAG: RluA family pseudouridine synthase [Lachnospiraceae bacterium]|nr:RluA family pseudouridine synthase [Lachnospiraceae bacterium]